jgi:hypothetical protein|tara:strand:+ start:506 stop:925 length:420 start_codon:yes stop_codon:yes gene_type:complete
VANKKRNTQKTINSLMGWPDNKGPFPSSLVECCEKACAKPLNDLSVCELQALIQNQIALPLVVERAVSELSENPLLCARHFEGDMMQTLLKLPHGFWHENRDLWLRVSDLLSSFQAQVAEINDAAVVFQAATAPSTVDV